MLHGGIFDGRGLLQFVGLQQVGHVLALGVARTLGQLVGLDAMFGYFIAGGILSGFGPALGEIIGNSFQMVVGLIVGFESSHCAV